MKTIGELLGKTPPTEAEKLALKIACEARGLVPTHIWASWPSSSMDNWADEVAKMVLRQLKAFNFREAS